MIPRPDDMTVMPVADLRAAFSVGRLSPRHVLEAQLSRVAAHNPVINALVGVEVAAARRAADRAMRRYRDGTARPLEGITVAIKEGHRLAGRVSTAGSLTHDGRADIVSAPSVARLLAAGAIPLGRSTTPEFMMAATTVSPRFGVTLNPWNPAFSPGGSSGGAAAAVAAGFVTLADGSDHGGSIRTPAACCGVVGYKAPWGRVPLPADVAEDTCLHYGLIGRHLEDVLFAHEVIAGQHPDNLGPMPDYSELMPKVAVPWGRFRVAVSADLGHFEVEPEISEHLGRLCNQMSAAGILVREAGISLPPHAMMSYEKYCMRLALDAPGSCVAGADVPVSDYVRLYLERATAAADTARNDAPEAFRLACNTVEAALTRVFENSDVLLVPVTTSVGVVPEFSIANPFLHGTTRKVTWEEEWQMTWPFNMASSLPVLSLPAGFDRQTGMPLGVQLIGPPNGEEALAAAALRLAPVLARR